MVEAASQQGLLAGPSQRLAADIADRDAIAAEPPLPAPSTPERDRLDRQHAAMVAALLLGFEMHQEQGNARL
jgi:hypothetical protein